MEGKAVLFKRFAGIDVFDIEVKANTPAEFINAVAAIAPTFGAINLEDIAAPACFDIEQALSAQLDIPVMHDDQHGTAVVIAAALLNALELQGKSLATARIVALGAGAAGIASLNLLVDLGARREHILVVDRSGVIHKGRDNLNRWKQTFAADTDRRTLAEALRDADVLLGVSGPNLVSTEMVRTMAPKPVILALSNPDPEIRPEDALAARPDAIIGCGRSDYPNQVNNVLGFPYIFRGALDVRARTVTRRMLVAAAQAIAALAREPVPREVLAAYKLDALAYGPHYILPKPLDPRLRDVVPAAVARAAVVSGVARAPYPLHYPA
jgi:malate dehydrogenase (oxaloacetate-decarboxylating)(NADP+)